MKSNHSWNICHISACYDCLGEFSCDDNCLRGICSVAGHCHEPGCAQCGRGPAGDSTLCAIGWESAAWEAMATQLRPGEYSKRTCTVCFSVSFLFNVFNQFPKNNFQVTSDQYLTVRRDGSLHIERVQLDDAGDYICLAENVIGATNHTTTVNVYGNVHKYTYKPSVNRHAYSHTWWQTQCVCLPGTFWALAGHTLNK